MKLVVRLSIVATLIASLAGLTACEPKEKDKETRQKRELLDKRGQWVSYKLGISSQYNFSYVRTGFLNNSSIVRWVEVDNDRVVYSSDQSSSTLTMDMIYQMAINAVDSSQCQVVLLYDSQRPIITSFSSVCSSDTSGVRVVDFHPGLPTASWKAEAKKQEQPVKKEEDSK